MIFLLTIGSKLSRNSTASFNNSMSNRGFKITRFYQSFLKGKPNDVLQDNRDRVQKNRYFWTFVHVYTRIQVFRGKKWGISTNCRHGHYFSRCLPVPRNSTEGRVWFSLNRSYPFFRSDHNSIFPGSPSWVDFKRLNSSSVSFEGKRVTGIFSCPLFFASTQSIYNSLICSSVMGTHPIVAHAPWIKILPPRLPRVPRILSDRLG